MESESREDRAASPTHISNTGDSNVEPVDIGAGDSHDEPAARDGITLTPRNSPEKHDDGASGKSREKRHSTNSTRSKRKRKHRSPSPSSSSSSSSSDNEHEHYDSDSHSKPKGFKIVPKNSEFAWELPPDMLEYIEESSSTYVPEKDIEEGVYLENPIPSNMPKPKKLDNYMKTILGSNSPALSENTLLERFQDKLGHVMGPLSRLWKGLEDVQNAKEEQVSVPVDEFVTLTEKTIFLIGQLQNSVTFSRRLGVLKEVWKDPRKALGTLKDKSDLFSPKDEKLFGEKFHTYISEQEKAKRTALEIFKAEKKAPFRGGPSSTPSKQSGGGRYTYSRKSRREKNQPSNGMGSYSKSPFRNKAKFNSRGKNLFYFKKRGSYSSISKADTGQPTPQRPPTSKKFISRARNPQRGSCRKGEIFQEGVVKTDSGPRNSFNSGGVQNTSYRPPNPEESPKPNSIQLPPKKSGEPRGFGNAGERSNSGSTPCPRRVSEQYLSSRQKECRQTPCHKFENLEKICALRALQNGRFAYAQIHLREKRFSLQDRLERCLFFSSLGQGVTEIYTIPMVRHIVSISVPMLWAKFCSKGIYKAIEDSNSRSETDKHQSHRLLRRHAHNGSDMGRNTDLAGHIDFSTTELRIHNQHRKINPGSYPRIGILGPHNKLEENGVSSVTGENFRHIVPLSGDLHKKDGGPPVSLTIDREVNFNSPSSFTCPNSAPLSPIRSDSGVKEIDGELQTRFCPRLSSQGGVTMMDRKSEILQWEEAAPQFRTGDDNPNRCIQNRLGSSSSGCFDRGKVVDGGAGYAYKCPRTVGCQIGYLNVYQKQKEPINSFTNRQQNCTVISLKNGRDPQLSLTKNQQKDLELPNLLQHHSYCGIPSEDSKCTGGLAIKEPSRLVGLETKPNYIPKNMPEIRKSFNRPLCFLTHQTVNQFYSWKPDPESLVSDAMQQNWGSQLVYAFPLFCMIARVARKVIQEKVQELLLVTPAWQTQAWYPLLMRISTTNPVLLNFREDLLISPQGQKHPLMASLQLVVWKVSRISSRWKGFQRGLPTLSQRPGDQDLSLITTRPGRNGLCGVVGGKFRAPLNLILDFLASLFEEKLQYRKINNYRSAISAYHNFVDGKPVGQHPRICALVSGVFNERPPQPKYSMVWDVDVVLKFIRNSWGVNKDLSFENLTLKLATLVALTAASRLLGHVQFNILTLTSCLSLLHTLSFSFPSCRRAGEEGRLHHQSNIFLFRKTPVSV